MVLHWGERTVTARCLASLARVTYREKSILLVDNGDAPAIDRADIPSPLDVCLVRPPANIGFCGGANLGFGVARGRGAAYVLLLNNDTVVEPDFLDALLDHASTVPTPALLCPQIMLFGSPGLTWYTGGAFSLWGGIPSQGYKRHALPADASPRPVDFATGCALLIDLALADEIGEFDRAFFAYCEDLDFSLRARAAGFPIFVVPASRVHHAPSNDEIATARRLYYSTRNLLEVMRRHAAWYQWLVFVPSFVVRWVAYHGALACLHGRRSHLTWLARGVVDFVARRLGERRV